MSQPIDPATTLSSYFAESLAAPEESPDPKANVSIARGTELIRSDRDGKDAAD